MSLTSGIGGAAQGASIGTSILPGIGTGIGAVGGLLAGLFSGGDDEAAMASIDQGIAAINALEIPELDKQLLLNTFQQNGTLTPEMLQKLNLNADTKQLLMENPENRKNQEMTMNALKQLSQTGMSAQDLAQMQESRSQVAGDTNAKTNQLLQQSQMRGTLGAGDTLAAQLMANQSGNQQASKDAINTAAAAAKARQDALMNYGNMASSVRGQDFNTENINNQNDIARKRFLDENSQSRQAANIAATNNANLYNLQRQQSVGDTNVGAQNAELARQKQAQYQMAQLKQNKAQLLNNAMGNKANVQAGNAAADAKGNAQMWAGVGQTADALAKKGTFDFLKPYDEQKGFIGPQSKAHGGEIEGVEVVPGDSEENDIMPVLASAGEFVIPKSKMKDAKSAKAFIDQHFGKQDDKHEKILELILDLHGKKSKG